MKDPNLYVQERLSYVFALFRRLGVARQVLRTLKQEKLKLPVRIWGGAGKGQLGWKEPRFGGLMRLLGNPAYAGECVARPRLRSPALLDMYSETHGNLPNMQTRPSWPRAHQAEPAISATNQRNVTIRSALWAA